jgi:hypothetical protein
MIVDGGGQAKREVHLDGPLADLLLAGMAILAERV